NLSAFTGCSYQHEEANPELVVCRNSLQASQDIVEVKASHVLKCQEHGQQEGKVSHSVVPECLAPGCGVFHIGIPETDQQIRAESYPLPSQEQQQQVIGQHQIEHG